MPDIVGTGYKGRDKIIRSFVKPGDPVYLIRDKHNQHDSNAIAVYVDTPKFLWFGGLKQIGFIDKERAAKISEKIDLGIKIEAKILSMYADMKFPRVTISWRIIK